MVNQLNDKDAVILQKANENIALRAQFSETEAAILLLTNTGISLRDKISDKERAIRLLTNANTSLRTQNSKVQIHNSSLLLQNNALQARKPWFESETLSNNCEVTTTAVCIKVDAVCDMEENNAASWFCPKSKCPAWKARMSDYPWTHFHVYNNKNFCHSCDRSNSRILTTLWALQLL